MFDTFTNMHYLSSSSSDSDSTMATEHQDLQYGYERGFTCHDELSQTMVSCSASSVYTHIMLSNYVRILSFNMYILISWF